MASGFLALFGFIYLAIVTIAAGFLIFSYQSGFVTLDQVISHALSFFPQTELKYLMWGAVLLTWSLASIPGFLLMTMGEYSDRQASSDKKLQGIKNELEKTTALTEETNNLLSQLIARDVNHSS